MVSQIIIFICKTYEVLAILQYYLYLEQEFNLKSSNSLHQQSFVLVTLCSQMFSIHNDLLVKRD